MKRIAISSLFCGVLLLSVTPSGAQEDTATQGVTESMAHSVDPQVYANLMNLMMTSPVGILTDPIDTCAQCHSEEDVERYKSEMGPLLQMLSPVNWMDPNAYMRMMKVPMDPETYTKWYEGWMKKYAGMLDKAAPTPEQ